MSDMRVISLGEKELREMIERERADAERYKLTPSNLEPLKIWIEYGHMPGDFLRAVLENDLSEACGRADLFNRRKLYEYVVWLYNEAPSKCWGSREKVKAWRGLRNGAAAPKLTVEEPDFDNGDGNEWNGRFATFDLYAEGHSLEELLESASYSVVDQDGGEMLQIEADDDRAVEFLTKTWHAWKQVNP